MVYPARSVRGVPSTFVVGARHVTFSEAASPGMGRSSGATLRAASTVTTAAHHRALLGAAVHPVLRRRVESGPVGFVIASKAGRTDRMAPGPKVQSSTRQRLQRWDGDACPGAGAVREDGGD